MDIKNLFGSVLTTNRSNQQEKNKTTASSEDTASVDDAVKSSTMQEKVTLTATAARFTQAQITLAAQPEVNRERVAELRKAISEGTYKVDATRLAGRMISFESSLQGK